MDDSSYTANKPVRMEDDSASHAGVVNFAYGADGNRVLQVATSGGSTTRTVYVGLGGTGKSLYERSSTAGSTPQHTFFIYAGSANGGNAFAVRILNDSGSVAANRYFGFDHLGLTTIVTDEKGHVASSTAGAADAGAVGYMIPGGARRNSDGRASDPATTFPVASGHREFTGQETIPSIGLVNMNGRVYDPVVGRFLSPDPNVQFVADLQSFNRYSYVRNNPLVHGSTGYSLFGSSWVDAGVGIGISLLGVAACAGTEGVGSAFFFAFETSLFSASAAMSNGASTTQVLIGVAIGAGTGFAGGAIGGAVADQFTESLAVKVVSGAIGGAASVALSSLATGHGLSWETSLRARRSEQQRPLLSGGRAIISQ